MIKTDSTILSPQLDSSIVAEPVSTLSQVKDTVITQIIQVNTEQQALPESDEILSGWLILFILGAGTALYFLSAFLKKYILPIFKTRYKVGKINIFWFRIRIIIWGAFSLFSMYLLLKASIIITLTLVLLFILVSHNFLIDFFIGIFYRFENQIRINDKFILGELSGKIKQFNSRHLQIVNQKNEDILIPYRNLLNQPITITKQIDDLKVKLISVSITGSVSSSLKKLNELMERCPWVYNSKNVNVEHIEGEEYKITVLAKEAFTFNKVEEYIHSFIKKRNGN